MKNRYLINIGAVSEQWSKYRIERGLTNEEFARLLLDSWTPTEVSAGSRPFVTGRRETCTSNSTSDVSSIQLSTIKYTRVRTSISEPITSRARRLEKLVFHCRCCPNFQANVNATSNFQENAETDLMLAQQDSDPENGVVEMEEENSVENLVVKVEVDEFPTEGNSSDVNYNVDVTIKTEPPDPQDDSAVKASTEQEVGEMPELEVELKTAAEGDLRLQHQGSELESVAVEMDDENSVENLVVKVEVDSFPTEENMLDENYNSDITIKTEPPDAQAYSAVEESFEQELTEMPKLELELGTEADDTQYPSSDDEDDDDDYIVPEDPTESLGSSDSRSATSSNENSQPRLFNVFEPQPEGRRQIPRLKKEVKERLELKLDRCSVGAHLESECHRLTYRKICGLISSSELSQHEKMVLENRTGLVTSPDSTICFHHKVYYLTGAYSHLQQKCCNPFAKHVKPRRKGLKTITFSRMQTMSEHFGIPLICGQKLCCLCSISLNIKAKEIISSKKEGSANKLDVQENSSSSRN